MCVFAWSLVWLSVLSLLDFVLCDVIFSVCLLPGLLLSVFFLLDLVLCDAILFVCLRPGLFVSAGSLLDVVLSGFVLCVCLLLAVQLCPSLSFSIFVPLSTCSFPVLTCLYHVHVPTALLPVVVYHISVSQVAAALFSCALPSPSLISCARFAFPFLSCALRGVSLFVCFPSSSDPSLGPRNQDNATPSTHSDME